MRRSEGKHTVFNEVKGFHLHYCVCLCVFLCSFIAFVFFSFFFWTDTKRRSIREAGQGVVVVLDPGHRRERGIANRGRG